LKTNLATNLEGITW